MDISLHNAETLRIGSHNADNANHIQIVIGCDDATLRVSIFDLPKPITDKLLLAFGDSDTIDYVALKEAAA